MNIALMLGLAILCEVVATSALRAADGFTRPLPSLLCLVGYAVAIYLLSLTVRTLPTGIVYAIWSGLGIVLVAALAWARDGQRLDMPGMIGLGLIIAGILVVNLLSKSVGH
ncbi:SMR family transporter [Amaricoccus solimangrovi]|uniref:QacE family quaternary ammonium compound efflux SMR transporter n=1 Tax=Amaricoccus solimangrovi TaxID=2589815 RepID=A0A501WZ38_9RHOB|nr:SMR family transporter [Amaricoccus solimangrovi]TPE53644.1 QacE family quaternary ammonium compound efflux SMR transporter [Amaricoccus solimangrovi]